MASSLPTDFTAPFLFVPYPLGKVHLAGDTLFLDQDHIMSNSLCFYRDPETQKTTQLPELTKNIIGIDRYFQELYFYVILLCPIMLVFNFLNIITIYYFAFSIVRCVFTMFDEVIKYCIIVMNNCPQIHLIMSRGNKIVNVNMCNFHIFSVLSTSIYNF